jgi:DNA-binding protein YbaB
MASVLSKLKQFKDLRSQAKQAQNILSQQTAHAKGAGGKVNVVMDGSQKILSLDIDANFLTPNNKNQIQRGVIEALEDANKQIQRVIAKKIQSGEMTMPDLSSLR